MRPTIITAPGSTPLVLDSPHSGTDYPADFRLCLRRWKRSYAAPKTPTLKSSTPLRPPMGVAWVEALFPRSYLDANRNTTEVDATMFSEPLARVRWRLTRSDSFPKCAWARA